MCLALRRCLVRDPESLPFLKASVFQLEAYLDIYAFNSRNSFNSALQSSAEIHFIGHSVHWRYSREGIFKKRRFERAQQACTETSTFYFSGLGEMNSAQSLLIHLQHKGNHRQFNSRIEGLLSHQYVSVVFVHLLFCSCFYCYSWSCRGKL